MECLAGEVLVLVLQTQIHNWKIGNNNYMSYLPEDVKE
jgi:hypothetical protein